jgi:hypothetical protein
MRDRRTARGGPGPLATAAPWVPVLVGVLVMVGLFVVAFASILARETPVGPSSADRPAVPVAPGGDGGPAPATAPPTPPPGAATGTAVAAPPPPSLSLSTRVPSAAGSVAARPGPPPPPAPPPRAGRPPATRTTAPVPVSGVRGRYRVMDSYQDSFIGEVLVTNTSGAPVTWTVELRFPSNVGALRTAWVESAPQATMRRSGSAYVFTGSVPLAAGASVPLRFHFERSGSDSYPSSCTANGSACTGVR